MIYSNTASHIPRCQSLVSTTSPSKNRHPHEQALVAANKRCQKSGFKLTLLRKQVLEIILSAGRPIGAYDIMAELAIVSGRDHVAPPTVYRSLDFLVEQALIHRVHSLNAFLPKLSLEENKASALFICQQCGHSSEATNNTIQQSLNQISNELRFQISSQTLEILGDCASCNNSKKFNDH